MKIARSLAILTGLVIIGLNVSAQTMDPEQTAQKETTEIKTNVTGITSNEESQILTVEREHAKSMWDARNTLTDKVALKTQTKELCDKRDAKIKAILTTDQYAQYLKTEKNEKKQG